MMLVQSAPWRGIMIVAVAALVAGCSRDAGRFGPPAAPPPGPATMAAPTPQVMTQPLPPPGELYDDRGYEDDEGFRRGRDPQIAALPPQDDPPAREDVLGQWAVSSDYDRCQLNVALTSWEGGYRASTRGCSSPELTNIGAWNIEGDLVVLKDGEGNPLGRLVRSGASRFDGRLELGGSISMSR